MTDPSPKRTECESAGQVRADLHARPAERRQWGPLTPSELTELGLTRIKQAGQIWLTLDPDQTELKTCTMAGTPIICIEIRGQ